MIPTTSIRDREKSKEMEKGEKRGREMLRAHRKGIMEQGRAMGVEHGRTAGFEKGCGSVCNSTVGTRQAPFESSCAK